MVLTSRFELLLQQPETGNWTHVHGLHGLMEAPSARRG